MTENAPSLPSENLPGSLESMSPSRYIEKVHLVTGKPMDEEIQPHKLLVRNHRDYHVADIQAQRFMSRLMRATGREREVLRRMKEVRDLGYRASEMVAKIIGQEDPAKVASFLFGLEEKEYFYRFKKPTATVEKAAERIARLRQEASQALEATRRGGGRGVRILLTGGTGFVGKEFLWQAAHDDFIDEVIVLARPKKFVDRERKQRGILSPAERGEELLRQLWLDTEEHGGKFRFIEGDIESPRLGISDKDYAELDGYITHVVHSAASVAFDATYEESFRSNVLGTLNALEFSRGLQNAGGSRFVAHISIETSYIHGRQVRQLAREDDIVFPRNFYNNYYELTKAMGTLETERFMLEHGLRVVQLCPAIVIGESRAGNNRGDTKVVNAPVNLFGLAHKALENHEGNWIERSKASMLARMACIFPGDPSAQINLIPVDWVVRGIVAATKRPEAIGERVHLAAKNRVTSDEMRQILNDEIGTDVKLTEPTLHRNVLQPILTKLLKRFKQDRLAKAIDKLGSIFGGYSEWGQPVHEVGKDIRVLGLPDERPDTQSAFRMLCRHNRYVLEFGRVRDLDEVSRRERLWLDFIHELEERYGERAGKIPPGDFHRAVEESFDLERFERKA